MAKLHEVLAVVGDLERKVTLTKEEIEQYFKNPQSVFMGSHRKVQMFDEARFQENQEDSTTLTTTVGAVLQSFEKPVSRHIDAMYHRDRTNQDAKGDVYVDEVLLLKDVPSTFLLSMESYLKNMRYICENIPVLKMGMSWTEAEGQKDVYMSKDNVTYRTEKIPVHKVIVPATEHHPAQVTSWTEDQKVASISKTEYSGAVTLKKKEAYLERLDKLIAGVKQARQRANNTEVPHGNVGMIIMRYLHNTS